MAEQGDELNREVTAVHEKLEASAEHFVTRLEEVAADLNGV
eukprot:SAG25_NODE_957_length_4554_cov_91.160943_8_plen_40_part_01